MTRNGLGISIRRTATLPDRLRLARYRKAPELGPRILFFSGGTALNPLARCLTEYTHNSIHLVTPFDSGGSSAKLRDAFNMPSVGDMRSRLMALADQSVRGNPEIYRLFSFRLPADAPRPVLERELASMVSGDHALVEAVPDPMRKIIRNHLRFFREAMPADFDLRGASVGNLILVGGYLNNGRHLDPVVFMFSKLVEARGTVRTVTGEPLHLVAELTDGTTVVGQRCLTGKEAPPIGAPVGRVYLTEDVAAPTRCRSETRSKVLDLIEKAELICFPMGSFYSSVVANLLPGGVAEAVRRNPCPKVYVPNTGLDPEQLGLSVAGCANTLMSYLDTDANPAATGEALDLVVVDSAGGRYPGGLDMEQIRTLGPAVVDVPMVTGGSYPGIDPERLLEVLLSLT